MEDFLKQIKKDREVKEFISKLSKDEIEMNICLFLEQVSANKICNSCKGKKECLSDVTNMQSYLIKDTSVISREYYPCSYKNIIDEDLLEILYTPNDIELGDIDVTTERNEIIKSIQEYKASNGVKGIYLYGSFGTGKTFLMLNLAKYLVKKGKKVRLAVKSNFGTMKNATWKSNKKTVATVKNGVVTGKKKGTAKISAKFAGKTYTCTVKVK